MCSCEKARGSSLCPGVQKTSETHYQVFKKERNEQWVSCTHFGTLKMRKDLIVTFAYVCVTKLRTHKRLLDRTAHRQAGKTPAEKWKADTSVEFTSCQELLSVQNTWRTPLRSQPLKGAVLLGALSLRLWTRGSEGLSNSVKDSLLGKSKARLHPRSLALHTRHTTLDACCTRLCVCVGGWRGSELFFFELCKSVMLLTRIPLWLLWRKIVRNGDRFEKRKNRQRRERRKGKKKGDIREKTKGSFL